MAPLSELTKKEGFKWGPKAQAAFELLKTKMTTAPILALPDFTKEFIIECDASGLGVGAILMKNGRPIAFFSKALGERNLSNSAYKKELMAVVLAIQHWRPYLLGRHFTVYSFYSLEKPQTTTAAADFYCGSKKLGSQVVGM